MATPPTPADWPPAAPPGPLAVLVSGGLDSAVLLAEAARAYPAVHPLYVRVGSVWEDAEADHLRRFLAAVAGPTLRPLVTFAQPVADLLGGHWSLSGDGVPGADTADDAVYLPGRNVLLLAKPLLWCLANRVPELATAPLAGNPFPDATPAFYAAMAGAVGMAVGGRVRVLRPYADLGLHKADVLRRGIGLPLEHTFSCLRPAAGRHCGRCNKCHERRTGFRAAGVPDPTEYAER
jgi:7-cyano-7-deazaguanine synthase